MTTVAITGATGRMGQELITAANDRPDWSIGAAVSQSAAGDTIEGVTIEPAANLSTILSTREIDVIVDFTVPAGTRQYVAAAVDTTTPIVIGTTGFNEEGQSELETASESIPLLKAANFARGIQVLLRILGDVAASLPDADIELIETHHNGKRDAPSGTAKQLLETIDEATETDDRVYGREGHAPRQDDNVGVHAVRAGDITGIHELLFAGNHEELRLTHRAEDRGVFAAGALDAAAWLVGQSPGWYDYQDVLAD